MNYDKYMKIIDLHTHSNKSDGTLSPAELVGCAKEAGLSAIALTDHDTAEGVDEAKKSGETYGIEIIGGVELVAEYMGGEIHILGYFIDYNGQYFNNKLAELAQIRAERNEKLKNRLASLNMRLSEHELTASTGGGTLTRLHFAKAMVKKGYAVSVSEAFERYLNPGRPAFVGRNAFGYEECIEIINNSGGVPALAHPYLYKWTGGDVVKMLERLRDAGLAAVEAIYPTHSQSQTAKLVKTALALGLKITGGSDFHGDNKPNIKIGTGMDNIRVQYEILEKLRG